MAALTMLAEGLAMIGRDHDDRVVEDARSLEVGVQASELAIDVRDRGFVGA